MKKGMTFRLESEKVKKAVSVLGCSNRTEAIDMALDIVIGNAKIAKGHEAMLGNFTDWQEEELS
ncbi:MAG: hypothetical protein HQL32_14175 [Planctomycetes bacterium]|nr:hypothetical protein [Planctomycetota bacterium]